MSATVLSATVHSAATIMRGEWRHLARTRLAAGAVLALVVLVVVAALVSLARMASEAALRHHYQAEADEAFTSQPDRHPHRMVHYGHYVFRTPTVLAAIDPGVDPVTGTAIFLEGHRRNTVTFAEARETSVLTRLGVLSPALVLQVFAPLLLILLGFSCVARERAQGTLLLLYAQGVPGAGLLSGKVLALAAVGLLAWLPLALATLWRAGAAGQELAPAAMLLAGYALYLLFWILLIVAVSALAGNPRRALLGLISLWAVATLLVPRLAADVAAVQVPVPPLAVADTALQIELRETGDSHDAGASAFRSLLDETLERYGVDRVEDLPVNFRGLVSLHGEAVDSAIMDRHAAARADGQRAQRALVSRFMLISPTLAIRQSSMAAAGTDLRNHHRFLQSAEAHRLAFVQHLNRLHAEELAYVDDIARSRDTEAERRTRISADHWAEITRFVFEPEPGAARAMAAWPGLAVLAVWVLAALLLLRVAVRRLQVS